MDISVPLAVQHQLKQLAESYEATARLIREGNADDYDAKAKAIRTTLDLITPTEASTPAEPAAPQASAGNGATRQSVETSMRRAALSMLAVAEAISAGSPPVPLPTLAAALRVRDRRRLGSYLGRLVRDGLVRKTPDGFLLEPHALASLQIRAGVATP
jgi:hypothetical protein